MWKNIISFCYVTQTRLFLSNSLNSNLRQGKTLIQLDLAKVIIACCFQCFFWSCCVLTGCYFGCCLCCCCCFCCGKCKPGNNQPINILNFAIFNKGWLSSIKHLYSNYSVNTVNFQIPETFWRDSNHMNTGHLNTGHCACPDFEWSTSLDHFILIFFLNI